MLLRASVTGKASPIRCGRQSCVIAATKPNTAQGIVQVITDRNGKTSSLLIAAVFASRYPDNEFELNKKFDKEEKAFATEIKGRRGVVTIIGSHSHASHDAYGVNRANARAQSLKADFKKLGVKARIDLIVVTAKTVKGGVAGANATWHP